MTVEVRLVPRPGEDADVVATPVTTAGLADAPEAEFLQRAGFTGATGQTYLLPPAPPGGPARLVVGLGSGNRTPDPVALRHMAAAAARATRRYARVTLLLPAPAAPTDAGALVEGFLLGAYRFTAYRSTVPAGTSRLDVVVPDTDAPAAKSAVDRAVSVARAVTLARDLGNEPGGTLTPAVFAQRAEQVAAAAGLTCEVWDRDRIVAERLGGLLGVNRGSTQPPRLVRLDYTPAAPRGTVALVGKGVTFDSGGLTIKAITMMFDMKLDMAGAAAVLGAMSALRDVDCPIAVTGWLPLTDNMSGGDATRLGDVLRIRDGTTVEVVNADAEGRLILADCLVLAAEQRPDAMVNLGTLSEALPMTAGKRVAGLTGNHPGWQGQVAAAAARAGEMVWQFPLDGVDRSRLDSKVADMVNTPHYRYGQTALAAIFLRHFVPDGMPWAHLDIQGPAVAEADEGDWVPGATGYGVRTLIELLCAYSSPGS